MADFDLGDSRSEVPMELLSEDHQGASQENGNGSGDSPYPVKPKVAVRGPIRGSLRYEVETSSPNLEAGKIFTIYLRITNPYDVPVEVQYVQFLVPVEFANETDSEVIQASSARWNRLWGGVVKDGNTVSPIRTEGSGTNPFFSGVVIARGENRRPSGNVTEEEWESVTIQPGNTVLRKISIRTLHWLFFSPAVYNLESVVRYVMDGQPNCDAVKLSVNIKAPLFSLIIGAGVGALVGSLFKLINDPKNSENTSVSEPGGSDAGAAKIAIGLLSSILLSAMVIVAFARKKDTQPFVSVEDFYGAVFVGFLVGINGASLLNSLDTESGVTGKK